MEVVLPSGRTAVFRDAFLGGDRREAKRGLKVVISPDGSRMVEGTIADDVSARLIRRMLVSWDVPGTPVPGEAQSEFLAQQILDSLDEEDLAALEAAVQPWARRVLRPDGQVVLTHVASGVQVTLVNPADLEKLAGSGEFTREGGDADPNPQLTPTGISSSAGQGVIGRARKGLTPSISS